VGITRLTHREQVLRFLFNVGQPYTATEIHRVFVKDGMKVTLASLSGTLRKMYDAGELRRVDDWGPRGGYGYQVNHT